MFIGELAKKSGFTRDAIRYYEKMGLIRCKEQGSAENNYKIYSDETLRNLDHIAKLKNMGFSLAQSKEVLAMADKCQLDWAGIKRKLLDKKKEIDEQIKTMHQHRSNIDEILEQYFQQVQETF